MHEEEQRDQALEHMRLHPPPVEPPYKLQQVFKEGDGEHPEPAGHLQETTWGGDAVTVILTQRGEQMSALQGVLVTHPQPYSHSWGQSLMGIAPLKAIEMQIFTS